MWAAPGVVPWGGLPPAHRYASTKSSLDRLRHPERRPVLIVEIETVADQPLTRRFSTVGFTTAFDDDPPNAPYAAALQGDVEMAQAVPFGPLGVDGGTMQATYGEVELASTAGLWPLLQEAVDGRNITFLSATAGYPAPSRAVVDFKGRARIAVAKGRQWGFDADSIRLTLQDVGAELNKPLQPNVYAGTGGAEGPEALKDKTKPLTFGRVFNMEPALLDAFHLIHQVHDGPIGGVDAVRDRGVPLLFYKSVGGGYDALVKLAVPPGRYAVAVDAGLVKLGTTPQGALRADVRGAVLDTRLFKRSFWSDGRPWSDGRGWTSRFAGHGYGETTARVLVTMLTNAAAWTLDEIDDGAMEALDLVLPYAMGIHFPAGDATKAADAVARVCAGTGCYAGPSRLGLFGAARIAGPRASAAVTLDASNVERLDLLPLPWSAPALGVRSTYRPNAAPLQAADLSALTAFDAATAEDLKSKGRMALLEDRSRQYRFKTAESVEADLLFADRAGADDFNARVMAIRAPGVLQARATTPLLGSLRLGQTVRLRWPDYGLDAGRLMVVRRLSELYGTTRATVDLLG